MSEPKEKQSPVLAKFKAHKEANSGEETRTLPESGVVITFPKFIKHGHWMAAQRQAKNDMAKAQTAYVASAVRFEGEKLTLADLTEMVSATDMMFILGEVFGGEDDEGDEDTGKKLTVN